MSEQEYRAFLVKYPGDPFPTLLNTMCMGSQARFQMKALSWAEPYDPTRAFPYYELWSDCTDNEPDPG